MADGQPLAGCTVCRPAQTVSHADIEYAQFVHIRLVIPAFQHEVATVHVL